MGKGEGLDTWWCPCGWTPSGLVGRTITCSPSSLLQVQDLTTSNHSFSACDSAEVEREHKESYSSVRALTYWEPLEYFLSKCLDYLRRVYLSLSELALWQGGKAHLQYLIRSWLDFEIYRAEPENLHHRSYSAVSAWTNVSWSLEDDCGRCQARW